MRNSLPDYQAATEQLKPEDYQRYFQGVTLSELVLTAVSATIDRDAFAKADMLEMMVDQRSELGPETEDGTDLRLLYVVEGRAGKKRILNIKATYSLILESEEDLPGAFYVIYGHHSGEMQAWPFIRELVA